ncbi:hypothetical protein EO238_34610, partial [Citrobacter sp. AAK_AS5]
MGNSECANADVPVRGKPPGLTTAVVAGRAHSFIEGAQAGWSWSTILKKRDAYQAAFDGFNPALVAAYDDARV